MGCIFSRHLLHVYGERNFIHNQYLHTVKSSTALLETCFAVIVIAFQVQVLKLSDVISYQESKPLNGLVLLDSVPLQTVPNA